jgi:hypothetical protein
LARLAIARATTTKKFETSISGDPAMNDGSTKYPIANAPRDYAVGYGRPPAHNGFRKGVSGNPRGRPRGMTAARAETLALKEAYRLVTVREGDKVMRLPVIQAVLRSQLALAVKGNGPAQRAVIATVQALDQKRALEAEARETAAAERKPRNYTEDVRRVFFLMMLAFEEKGVEPPEKLDDALKLFAGDPAEMRKRAEQGRGEPVGAGATGSASRELVGKS